MFVAILVVLGVLLLGWFMLLPAAPTEEQEPLLEQLRGRNYAHRGLHTRDKTVPENSLPAFRAAIEAGYGIELDVQLSQDGEVVVFHDDDLARVCSVEGRVDSYTLAQLQEMRLEGSGETIPTLAQLLETVAGRAPLIVELKMGPRNAQLCAKVCEQLRAYPGPFCVESFDPRIVHWFKRHAPEFVRGQLSAPASHLSAGPAGALVSGLFTNVLARPHFIAYCIGHIPPTARFARGLAIKVAWTARAPEDAARLERENDMVIFEYYHPAPAYTRES